MTRATMTSKGRVTLPKSMREGEARELLVTRPAAEAHGMLARKGRAGLSVEEADRKLSRAFKEKRV